jgi:hypothetical protein
MSHRPIQFGTVTLPNRAISGDVGTGRTLEATAMLPGGAAFDARGAGTANTEYPYTVTWECTAENPTTATLVATVAQLRGMRGQRQALYLVASGGGGTVWSWARLLRVGQQRGPDGLYHQPLSLEFQVWSAWYGTLHDTAGVLPASAAAVAVSNGGNQAATDVVVTVGAVGAALTSVKVGYGDCEWQYGGTVGAGSALVVDCGARTVLNGGVADYAAFALTASHKSDHWLSIPPGAGTITVTYAGGGTASTFKATFYDAWE